MGDQKTEFLAKMREGLAADFDFFGLIVVPCLRKGGKARPNGDEQAAFLAGARGGGNFCFQRALGFAKLGKKDGLGGYLPEISGETQFIEDPNDPLGGIELPRFDPVAVVVLKFVVIVMVPLAECDERHDPAIAGAAPAGVRPGAERVAGGIDAESTVLEENHPRDAAD